MRPRRSRKRHAWRVTEEQRSAAENTYLNSLQQQQSRSIVPKQQKSSDWVLKLGCLIICILIAIGILLIELSANLPARPSSPVLVPIPASTNTAASFCSTQDCIPKFPNGKVSSLPNGSTIECKDGWYSHSGGRRGACSYHSGEVHP